MNRRSNENGIAMIIALFMVLALSVLGSSLMFISQSETWSSSNYRITSQARYAAESGVHHAANFLLNTGTYTPPSTSSATDPLTGYTTTATPVLSSGNNQAVVLSSDTTKWPSNYPYATAQTNFANTVKNENISLSGSKATYHASAKLLSMQAYTDAYSGQPSTIQTWEITSVGTVEGARNSSVEVSAVVEQQLVPLYRYAAFATANGCAAPQSKFCKAIANENASRPQPRSSESGVRNCPRADRGPKAISAIAHPTAIRTIGRRQKAGLAGAVAVVVIICSEASTPHCA